MRFFTERVGISSSYIHDIERGRVLPSQERLDLLASVFVQEAAEQGAADPEDDARLLYRAREHTMMVKELGFAPALADAVTALSGLSEEERTFLAEPLRDAIRLYPTLHRQVQSGLARRIGEIVRMVSELEGSEDAGGSKVDIPLEVVEAVHGVLEARLKEAEAAKGSIAETGIATTDGSSMPPVPTPS